MIPGLSKHLKDMVVLGSCGFLPYSLRMKNKRTTEERGEGDLSSKQRVPLGKIIGGIAIAGIVLASAVFKPDLGHGE